MAKTFEAMEKFEKFSAENRGAKPHPSRWNSMNFSAKSGLADILSKMGIESNSDKSYAFHFASAQDGEGTTTILTNLARFMIENKSTKKILFIDGNLESPVFHVAFNLPLSPGFSEAWMKKVKLSEAIHKIDNSTVSVMPAGNPAICGNVGLESQSIFEFVKALRKEFQVVIFDSPPVLSSPNSLLWANAADVSYLVIQANRTQWEVAKKAQALLEKHNFKIGGVVLNHVKHSIPQWLYKRL
jgi:capsular exopolysaccharide synthesis family protein